MITTVPMITEEDYFAGYKDNPGITDEMRENARTMLALVNALLDDARTERVLLQVNPGTGTLVSGNTDGGWRPQECHIGAPQSAHKQGRAVDVCDPDGDLDRWITDPILASYGLYREHPSATPHWVHLTDRGPPSGSRTFFP